MSVRPVGIPMDKDTVTGLIVENRQKKGLYGIKNVSLGRLERIPS